MINVTTTTTRKRKYHIKQLFEKIRGLSEMQWIKFAIHDAIMSLKVNYVSINWRFYQINYANHQFYIFIQLNSIRSKRVLNHCSFCWNDLQRKFINMYILHIMLFLIENIIMLHQDSGSNQMPKVFQFSSCINVFLHIN